MNSEYENGPNSIKNWGKDKKAIQRGVCDIPINYPILKANKKLIENSEWKLLSCYSSW